MTVFASVRYRLVPEHKGKENENIWKVEIVLHHHHEWRTIPTNLYAASKDITPQMKLRNNRVLHDTMELLHLYRQRLEHLKLRNYELDTDTILKIITVQSEVDIDFLSFGEHWIENKRKVKKGIGNYIAAFNSFKRFIGKDKLPCSKMSAQLLKEFERSMSDSPCAQYNYTHAIKFMFNELREIYNDNDSNMLFVKRSVERWEPDKPYYPKSGYRALTLEQIRAIAAIPDEKRANSKRNFARDVFLISFMTMGTNAIDLYNCEYDENGNITYERAKVKNRRADKARMVIRPYPLLLPYLEKYNVRRFDPKKVFRFYRNYNTPNSFTYALDRGLKSVGEAIGVPGLTFYAARHSMATIATNDLGINKYVVHEMLNHRIPLFRVTSMYIRKTFDEINAANFKLLDYVFGEREEEGVRNTFVDPDGEFGSSVFIDCLEEVDDNPISFNYMVIPQDKLPDDTWRVIIRMAYEGEDVDIPTSIIVGKDDLNRDFEIMDASIIDRCEALAEICRDKISDINFGTIDNIQDILAILRD